LIVETVIGLIEIDMPKDVSFHDYIVYDLIGDIPYITSRAMFGGWAIYKCGVIFGIIIDAQLYFKVDNSNRFEYERAESHPFVYTKGKGKPVTMSYWLVTEEIMDDKERLYDLIERSVAISQKKKL